MKKQESGRSMVEMLGVLAIIGVLSIGGIAGYTLSMRRFRVNNALDIVNKYALTTYSACQSKMLIGAVSNMAGCNKGTGEGATEKSVAFLSSGLGGLPSGVEEIGYPVFTAMNAANATNTNKNLSSDKVEIPVKFSDAELCKTAASITGGSIGTSGDNHCEVAESNAASVFTFTIYMN